MAQEKAFSIYASDFFKRMELYGMKAGESTIKAMKQNGEDLLKEAGKLAPVDEGTLIGSGNVQTSASKTEIVTTTGFNTPYATKVHYEMAPAPFAKIQPGPRTRLKAGTEFGEAGGLYLQRPLIGKREKYSKHVADTLKKDTNG